MDAVNLLVHGALLLNNTVHVSLQQTDTHACSPKSTEHATTHTHRPRRSKTHQRALFALIRFYGNACTQSKAKQRGRKEAKQTSEATALLRKRAPSNNRPIAARGACHHGCVVHSTDRAHLVRVAGVLLDEPVRALVPRIDGSVIATTKDACACLSQGAQAVAVNAPLTSKRCLFVCGWVPHLQ